MAPKAAARQAARTAVVSARAPTSFRPGAKSRARIEGFQRLAAPFPLRSPMRGVGPTLRMLEPAVVPTSIGSGGFPFAANRDGMRRMRSNGRNVVKTHVHFLPFLSANRDFSMGCTKRRVKRNFLPFLPMEPPVRPSRMREPLHTAAPQVSVISVAISRALRPPVDTFPAPLPERNRNNSTITPGEKKNSTKTGIVANSRNPARGRRCGLPRPSLASLRLHERRSSHERDP